VNRTQIDPDKMNHTIVPAAACLTLLTAGSLSVYGNFDLILPLLAAIAGVFVIYMAVIMVTTRKIPV
jgi:hypothetical protein